MAVAASVASADEVMKVQLAKLAPDLAFLLNDKGVPMEVQSKIAHSGFTTVRLFALAADGRNDLRAMLADEPFKLTLETEEAQPGDRIKTRVAIAQVVDAWESAVARVSERNKTDAEQRATGVPLTLPGGDHVELRRAYENSYGRVADKEFPADALVERRLQEVEQGDMRAESLVDVASRDEMKEDPTEAVWFQGALKVKRSLTKVPLPADAEALRRRIELLGMTYTVAKMRNPMRAWLGTAGPEIWATHIRHILGDTVYGLRIKSRGHEMKPDWEIVLSYEHEIRKDAMRAVLYDGLDLAAALARARKDMELRERFFVAPGMCSIIATAAFEPGTRSSAASVRSHPYEANASSSGGGGNGGEKSSRKRGSGSKGGGKGGSSGSKGGSKGGHKHDKTPQGNPICFNWNRNKCTESKCTRVHCCTICFGTHRAADHTAANNAEGTK